MGDGDAWGRVMLKNIFVEMMKAILQTRRTSLCEVKCWIEISKSEDQSEYLWCNNSTLLVIHYSRAANAAMTHTKTTVLLRSLIANKSVFVSYLRFTWHPTS